MQISQLLWSALGLVVGGGIGYFFGRIQEAAQKRNQMRENAGKFKNAWAGMPGSTGRVFYLLIALVLIQVVCPLLFANGIQWMVSAGVAMGYGAVLYRQLTHKRQLLKNK